jgi:ribosomal protein L40E
MRDRHLPRVCRSCNAPMAGQDDSCWKCGAAWDYRLSPRNPAPVIHGSAAERPESSDQPLTPASGRHAPVLTRT